MEKKAALSLYGEKPRSKLKGKPFRGTYFCEHRILWIKLQLARIVGSL
jgi:hypothetical protein